MSTQDIINGWDDGIEPYNLGRDTVEQHGAAESFSSHDLPAMLRSDGSGTVETNKGARFPVADAERTYRFALAVRENIGKHFYRGWRRNGEQHAIGMYQLDAINEQGVIAGCHRVSWDEIERFAATMNW